MAPSTFWADTAGHESRTFKSVFFPAPAPPGAHATPGRLRAGRRSGPTDVEMCFRTRIQPPQNRSSEIGPGCYCNMLNRRMRPEPDPGPDSQPAGPKPHARSCATVLVAFLDIPCTCFWPLTDQFGRLWHTAKLLKTKKIGDRFCCKGSFLFSVSF